MDYNKIGVVILIASLLCMVQITYADQPLPTPVGKVVWVKGPSLKASMPNKEQRLLQKSSIIYLHDILSTDSQTQAEIVFTNNTWMNDEINTIKYQASNLNTNVLKLSLIAYQKAKKLELKEKRTAFPFMKLFAQKPISHPH